MGQLESRCFLVHTLCRYLSKFLFLFCTILKHIITIKFKSTTGIHRNLGVHISKVKSVNLDSWSPEQVAYMQLMGNSKARAVYEANLPDNFKRPQADSGLEAFVRSKYEQKKYIAKEWVQPPTPKPAVN